MPEAALTALANFPGVRVLVIGEAMLDSYLEGRTSRLCREAPVPVVNVERRIDAPGGAANTACNVAALGGRVSLLSVTGDDVEAALLRQALKAGGVAIAGLVADPGRRTLAKHRVLADGQMVVRYDQGTTVPLDADAEDTLIRRLQRAWRDAQAVIISDYCYGVLTPRLVAAIGELQGAQHRILIADSRRLAAYRGLGLTAVKPNCEEVADLLGLPDLPAGRLEFVVDQQERILERTGAAMAAVTLDREGVLLLSQDGEARHMPAPVVKHAQVAGAGDTFVAAFALALGAACAPQLAGELAAAAAAVVVDKDGTATCSGGELREHLTAAGKYVADHARLAARVDALRQQGHRIVFTNGCFDILHSGHITYLNGARGQGDVLVVGLNSDESVRRLKGHQRPVNGLEDRARVLAALSCVDFVAPFEEDTPAALITLLRPDLFVKGGDYSGKPLPEAALVESLGGRVQLLPFVEDHSTSRIIARIRSEEAGTSTPPGGSTGGRRGLAAGTPGPLPSAG